MGPQMPAKRDCHLDAICVATRKLLSNLAELSIRAAQWMSQRFNTTMREAYIQAPSFHITKPME